MDLSDKRTNFRLKREVLALRWKFPARIPAQPKRITIRSKKTWMRWRFQSRMKCRPNTFTFSKKRCQKRLGFSPAIHLRCKWIHFRCRVLCCTVERRDPEFWVFKEVSRGVSDKKTFTRHLAAFGIKLLPSASNSSLDILFVVSVIGSVNDLTRISYSLPQRGSSNFTTLWKAMMTAPMHPKPLDLAKSQHSHCIYIGPTGLRVNI